MQWSGFPTSTNIEDRRPTPSPFDRGLDTPASAPWIRPWFRETLTPFQGPPIPTDPSKIDINKIETGLGRPNLLPPTPESLSRTPPTDFLPSPRGMQPVPGQPRDAGELPNVTRPTPSLPPGPPPPSQAPRMPTPDQGPISPLPTSGGMPAASPVALPTISTGATPQKSSASSLDQPAAPAAPKPPQPIVPPAPPAMPAPQARRGGSLYASSLGMMASQPLDTVARRIGML